mmetsp:Transcript_54987/g.164728  ORF Transcript_54987/g.164728 Transcript_54987/m.164728 type:complete len:232 (-) Transcript_54987:86-781(-)
MHLELTRSSSVRSFARTFVSSGRNLHGLVNNAGMLGAAGLTGDGLQSTFQVNCAAPALLTELLLPATSDDFRVVNVSSEISRRLVGSVADNCPPHGDGGAGTRDYALSKAGQVVHAHGLSQQFAGQGRMAFAVEPGLVRTNILRHSGVFARWFNYSLLGSLFLRTEDEGGATTLFCLLAPVEDLIPEDERENQSFPAYYYADCKPMKTDGCYASVDEIRAQEELFKRIWGH